MPYVRNSMACTFPIHFPVLYICGVIGCELINTGVTKTHLQHWVHEVCVAQIIQATQSRSSWLLVSTPARVVGGASGTIAAAGGAIRWSCSIAVPPANESHSLYSCSGAHSCGVLAENDWKSYCLYSNATQDPIFSKKIVIQGIFIVNLIWCKLSTNY